MVKRIEEKELEKAIHSLPELDKTNPKKYLEGIVHNFVVLSRHRRGFPKAQRKLIRDFTRQLITDSNFYFKLVMED